ncbi:uncharacterized protein G2W53_010020 [Senna tora]|uniref:Uncharacterized protein n=1 Tax=Senna tora TaxID=362788 RepID=A0A834WZ55_9FABA|nr:uncharacterized protein G2W53_010020 [Senna tora]
MRPRFVARNMLGHDPRSSHAKTTPIGSSKPLWFASTTQTDVFDSLAQRVFCLVSEILPRFVVRNMLRHDPRSSHAKTTPIRASKPLRFSEIRLRFVVWNMLRHDPRSSHAKTTPIVASKPLRFACTTRTDVFDSLAQRVFCLVSEIRLRFVVWNMLRHDPRSSHAKTTPIVASKPLRFAFATRTDVFDSLAQQVFCLVSEIQPQFVAQNMMGHDPRSSHAKTTPIGASKPLRFPRSDHDLSSGIYSEVSEIRPRFFDRNMLRGDPRLSHAKTTPIGASKQLRFACATQTDVFDSLAQQAFCLVIREGF